MNTPIPTANSQAAAPEDSIGALTTLVPNGLPDENILNRLANEFFSAIPGLASSSNPSAAATAPVPSAAQAGTVAPTTFEPQATPSPRGSSVTSTGNGAPDIALQSAAGTGKPGNAMLGIPEVFAAALPVIDAPASTEKFSAGLPVSPPSSPFYFLGESSAYSQSAPIPLPEASSITNHDRVIAQTFGLPGTEELNALLSTIEYKPTAEHTAKNSHTTNSQTENNGGWFYFVDGLHARNETSNSLPLSAHPAFDVNAVRRDFPILQERVNGRPLIWFDNAATTHKPQAVIDRLAYFYAHENSNIHRAAHELAARATDAYEAARNKVARFIGASSVEEIIFVRGATEAINLVAKTWGEQHIQAGDEIIVSNLEHHANIVPWQQLVAKTGAKIRVIPVDNDGQIILEEYQRLLNPRTKLVAITQVSNALGTVTPVKEIIDAAHRNGSCVLVDGAQSVSHMRVNVQALDADFFVFSGHKIFAPTGIGVVYGKKSILDTMQPWQGGGNMIEDVTFEHTRYQPAPARFEAGTGNIADAVGLGAALDYVERIGIENIARYEHDLLAYATHGLKTVPGLRLIGTAKDKASVASFVLDGHTTEEVGKALNREGIAVRSGHHCAQPILRRFGVEATVRPSFAFYNTCQEIDVMIATLHRLQASYKAGK
ncbi:MAG: family 2A encapsulin nanocompartment cargo protein cysteine desulfurase [Spongiibacteraceae bacterium]